MTALPIRFVLVDTSHPGNIGAAARAMKNMELTELALVRPRHFPHPDATARASGADDVLARARVSGTLAEALAGCSLVLASTSRERDHYYRVLDVREAAARAVAECATAPVAIVFGGEHSGLSNEDLQPAHALLRIPTGAAYASLNLAMAVQVVAYEILRARGAGLAPAAAREQPLADAPTLARLYEHLEAVLDEVDFRDRTQNGSNLINRLRRLFQRAELDHNEVNILRGFLTAVQQRRRRAGEPVRPA
ncbi:MAG TPA: RNA methyltransferase [Steroidobacteraceae bacterium]|nr:RNA methyltransferase [Steroidobacteraceae bacterium]